MPDALSLVQLQSFVAIADCGGFGRAAATLHLTQSAVSQHVRRLERRLNKTLVEKDGRVARFTADGERLLGEARRILAVHDDALERLDAAPSDALVVGAPEHGAEQFLPQLRAALNALLPERPVRFVVDRSSRLRADAAKGLLDAAVTFGLALDAPGRRVGSAPLRWYASESLPRFAPRSDVPVVAYSAPCAIRSRTLVEATSAGHRGDVAVESGSLQGILSAARAGLGVTVLPAPGRAPDGLVERTDLPHLGAIGVHLVVRRGLDLNVESAALDAVESFFDDVVPQALHAS